MLYKHMILDDVGVTKKIWSDYILVTFWLHIMVYGYTESDVIAESRGWNAMSGDNDVVCVLWICVVVGTESYVCDQLPKLPEEPPPIGDCASVPTTSYIAWSAIVFVQELWSWSWSRSRHNPL